LVLTLPCEFRVLVFLLLSMRRPPCSTLFPYTTLFRSVLEEGAQVMAQAGARAPARALGHITSSYHSAVLGRSIALGLERPSTARSEEHTSELQSLRHLVCRLLLEKKKKKKTDDTQIKE